MNQIKTWLLAAVLVLSASLSCAQGILPPPPGAGTAADIKVGVTTITSGTTGRPLYDNGGLLGEYASVPVAFGGTNCTAASITCFNNITGFSAAGTTGTTSTNLVFSTSPTLITPVIGIATGTSLAVSSFLNVGDTTASGATVLNAMFSTDTQAGSSVLIRKSFTGVQGPSISQVKSRGTAASPSIVSSADNLGSNAFFGYDGASYIQAAVIQAKVDGTPGTSDMPGRLEFLTTLDGAAATTLRMVIFNDGGINIGSATTSPGAGLFAIQSTTDASASTGGALQVAGGASVAKRFWLPAITASAGLQTAVLCQSSGGEVIADSVACLASSARFKDIAGPMEDGVLAKLAALPMWRWNYKPEGIFHNNNEHVGPIAEDVAAMDSRLAGYDSDGKVRTYSTEQLLAFTIKAVQELNQRLNRIESAPH